MIDRGTCDTCGAPATSLARDIKQTTQPGDTWHTYAPKGALKRGCDQHPARAVLWSIDDTVLGAVTDDAGRPIPL